MKYIELCVQVKRGVRGNEVDAPFGGGGFTSAHAMTYAGRETIGIVVSSYDKFSTCALCLAEYIRRDCTCCNMMLYAQPTNEGIVFLYSDMLVPGFSYWKKNISWQFSIAGLFRLPALLELLQDSKNERKMRRHLKQIYAMPLMPEFDVCQRPR